MDLETFRDYCLSKLAAIESTPFGEDVLVFKVAGKIFALAPLDEVPATANLKCDPDLALELRAQLLSIQKFLYGSRTVASRIYQFHPLAERTRKCVDQQWIMRTTKHERVDPFPHERFKVTNDHAIRELIIQPGLLN